MKVVIVGSGFAGVKAALQLAKDDKVKVTLVTERDHFLFYPALYATATGRSRRQSILPLQEIFKNTSVKIVIDKVVGIDSSRHLVIASDLQIPFDRLVLAMGVVTTYFGIEGLDQYSYSIKSAKEIERFKKHLHSELVSDRHMDKNYMIVGGGPTGVELAAALAYYLKRIADKHKVKHSKIRLSIVEAEKRILPRLSEEASALVTKQLKNLGITIMTNKRVESEDDDSIIISGKDIPSKTVIWTSGVTNHPFFGDHPDIFRLARNGRVDVDENLKVNSRTYVIGDNANTTYTGLAQTALHDGVFVAKSIGAEVRGKALPVYRARKQPVVIPVGENWALLEYGPIRLTGFLASIIRRAADLVGYLDYFPLPTALRLFFLENKNEEVCTVCRKNLS